MVSKCQQKEGWMNLLGEGVPKSGHFYVSGLLQGKPFPMSFSAERQTVVEHEKTLPLTREAELVHVAQQLQNNEQAKDCVINRLISPPPSKATLPHLHSFPMLVLLQSQHVFVLSILDGTSLIFPALNILPNLLLTTSCSLQSLETETSVDHSVSQASSHLECPFRKEVLL